MIRYRDLFLALESMHIPKHDPVLVLSDPALGSKLQGGVQTALTALMEVFDTMMMPAFTSSPLIVPQEGPGNNAMDYDNHNQVKAHADFFKSDLEPDEHLGELVRLLMRVPESRRSAHPLLSFAGLGVDAALQTQKIPDPWAPIFALSQMEGWVLLCGVDQSRNICLHLAEKQSGRKQFIRWALTNEGVLECNDMPGCTKGFGDISDRIIDLCRKVFMPSLDLAAYPIRQLIDRVVDILIADPSALMCKDATCPFCSVIRGGMPVQP